MSVESDQTAAKSYRYLRIAMIGVLLALAASVFYQSSQQGSFLASVSAYYYTSAQGVFVGGLALILAAVILAKTWDDGPGTAGRKWAFAGLSGAVLLWAAGLIALLVSVDWVAGNAHYIAAISLGVCILIVVEANARRHQERGTRTNAENLLPAYRYTWIGRSKCWRLAGWRCA